MSSYWFYGCGRFICVWKVKDTVSKNNFSKSGWVVKLRFQLVALACSEGSIHKKDKAILEQMVNYLGAGKISVLAENSTLFRVESIKDLEVVINHFDKYPLLSHAIKNLRIISFLNMHLI